MVGKHNYTPDSEFNAEQLRVGIEIEKEHTDDPEIAKSIAKDHLSEISDYYTRLIRMEQEAKAGSPGRSEGLTVGDVATLALLRNIR